jgi:RNA polymerase sigma-70 factor (ECF subfamily)
MKPDNDGIRLLYEQHARALATYACSLLSEFATAEDVVHQVFQRLLRGDIELRNPPVPYLYTAVRNATIDCLRKRPRNVALTDAWFKNTTVSHEAVVLLQSALREIPEEQREVVVMHVWGQLTFDEIGSALDISPKTAASRYRYGLAKLREQFKPVTKG